MKKSLLYLEDDETLAYVTQRALKQSGWDIHHASTLTRLRELIHSTHYNYALLDLKIGNQTSLTLIQEIKKVKDIPIVIVSGYGTIRTAVQAMKFGAIDFLSKPCSVNDILKAFDHAANSQAMDESHALGESQAIADPEQMEKPSLRAIERETIQKALDDNNGNISAAARQLKMHRRTLQRKLQKRHTEVPELR